MHQGEILSPPEFSGAAVSNVAVLERPSVINSPPQAETTPTPYYALSEDQIRAKVAHALTKAEERKAAALAAGEAGPAPLILMVTEAEDHQIEDGQIQDINKARVMAEAERPYRDRVARKVRKAQKIMESMQSPESWWTFVREPIKSARAVATYVGIESLLDRAYNAATIAGLEFEKIVEAAKPYVPKVDVSDTISSVVDWVGHGKHEQPTATHEAAPEISPHTGTLVEQLKLDSQLAEQLQIWANTGLLRQLSNGEFGIIGEDGKDYPAPTPVQIRQLVEKQQPLIERKAKQGFTRMLVVPQAAEASQLGASLKNSTIAHYKDGNLHDAVGLPLDIGRHNAEHPDQFEFITTPSELKKVKDTEDEDDEDTSSTPGWKVIMVKNMPESPRQEKDIVVFGGRGEFIAGLRSPKATRKGMESSPVCAGEKGIGLKTWLTYALTEMERSGTMVDVHSSTLLLGATVPNRIFKGRNSVPWIGWAPQYRKGSAQKWLKVHWGAGPNRIKQYDMGVRTEVVLR